MDPHVLLRTYDAAPPVRWEATLLGGGWRGHADDELLPAAGLVLDAALQGAVALEGTRWLGWDRRRLIAAPARGRGAARGAGLVDDLVDRVGRASADTPYGWCERAAVFAPDAVAHELEQRGWVRRREAGRLRRALRYRAFEVDDHRARELARARVRGALADPAGADDAAVALTLLLRATDLLRHAAGMTPSRRTLRRPEERRAALPAVAAAVLEALDARRRRLDLVGT